MKCPFIFKILTARVWLAFFSFFFITSCLQDRPQKTVISSSRVSWFEGVFKVSNIGGIPANVKVEWNRSDRTVTAYRVYSLVENIETKQNEWTLIDEVNSETLVYNHSNLISGRIYSYRVKAVGTDDVEDTNTKQLSTVVFEGIGGVRVTGKTTATVSLNSSLGAFDEIRIYATPKRTGGVKKIVATAKGNVQNVNVTGLRSGTAYKFSASAFISYLNTEDGNEYTKEDQTYSESFGSGVANDSDYAYRGVLSLQGFGLAPNAEVGPSDRLIRLTWLPFINSSAQTKYRVIRVAGSGLIDTTTTKMCTAITDTSCIACEVTGAGFQHCDDTQLAPPPKRYDYVVSIVRKDATTGDEWVEELPTTNKSDFRITAHVPPDYMVLVQRDAANFEMCSQLGQSSNPRKKQRCIYSGMGATPYNSGPGKSPMILDPNYYDFGYNLFVDRYKLACNWTRQTDGGNCGVGGSPGDCVGITHTSVNSGALPPNDSLGTSGNVYFAINATYGHNCYIKVGSTWKESKLNTLTPAERRSATTNDPGPTGKKHRPVIQNMGPVDAFNLCQAHTTSYGAKRLMRRREHLVMAVPPALDGEPNAVTDTRSRISIERGIAGIVNNECGITYSNLAPNVTTINDLIAPTNTRGQLLTGGNYAPYYSGMYFIGTQSTKNCVTRWGNQDYNGYNRLELWLSDSFVRTSATTGDPLVLQGDVSEFDNGSRDFSGFRVDGALGQNYNKTGGQTIYEIYPTNPSSPGNNYILPLGMPIINWTGPSQTLIPILELFNRSFFGYRNISGGGNDLITFDSNGYTRFYLNAGLYGRTSFTYGGDAASVSAKALCAVEAE